MVCACSTDSLYLSPVSHVTSLRKKLTSALSKQITRLISYQLYSMKYLQSASSSFPRQSKNRTSESILKQFMALNLLGAISLAIEESGCECQSADLLRVRLGIFTTFGSMITMFSVPLESLSLQYFKIMLCRRM